jgi:uncharacterized protein (TIGR00730 family)
MTRLSDVSVFCGSHVGNRPSFAAAATELGNMLTARGIGLVYGGASVGLMGRVADAVLSSGGRVVGVITESLADHEIAHTSLSRLDIVGTMHERKARMAELSDAVIMLPGGFGTYEEFMETVTWAAPSSCPTIRGLSLMRSRSRQDRMLRPRNPGSPGPPPLGDEMATLRDPWV